MIRVLDLEFVAKRDDGRVDVVDAGSLDGADGFDLSGFAGASSGILDQSDLDTVGAELQPGSVAAVLVYEERSLLAALGAWERAGGRRVHEGSIEPDELLGALDATDPA